MVYFLADIHLGSPMHRDERQLEQTFVAWVDAILPDATAVYLLGDIFDFWYEYRHVVPKGFIRVLGALARLCDRGVAIHYLIGNHDIWCRDYFEKELNATLHKHAFEVVIDGKRFRLAHGDEEYRSRSFSEDFIYRLFRNPLARMLLSAIHPRWVIPFGKGSARESRKKHRETKQPTTTDELKNEWLVKCTLRLLEDNPQVDYYLFGHRHLLHDLELADERRLILLGDWLTFYSYASWDGHRLQLHRDVSSERPLGIPHPTCEKLVP